MIIIADAAYGDFIEVPTNNPAELAVIVIQNKTNTNSKKYEA